MGALTAIGWTDATWNPVRGCTRVSEGCRRCYAERTAARFSSPGQPFHGYADPARTGSAWTGQVDVMWQMLDHPIRWRTPRRIFVNSMSDLFHESLLLLEIAHIFAVMVAAVHLRGHIFQVLTKRASSMRAILRSPRFWDQVNAEAGAYVMERTDPLDRRSDDARATLRDYGPSHPPPGIWLGVSVEHQEAANERIPEMLATPAALRFLSCEPLLGPVDLTAIRRNASVDFMRSTDGRFNRIDWIIAGGESGAGARPANPAWFRSLRDQCAAAAVPFFFKQWGEWAPAPPAEGDTYKARRARGCRDTMTWPDFNCSELVGIRRAGDTLDGVRHQAFPEASRSYPGLNA